MHWSKSPGNTMELAYQVTRRPNPSGGQGLLTAKAEKSQEMLSHLQCLNKSPWISASLAQ